MCAIVGAVSSAPVDPGLIRKMRDRMAHRGPDHAGLWLSPDCRVGLGHRRLAILDLSPEANQPFVSSDGRFVIVFNGEIYNFQALRKELESRGARFRTRSDTEVLLEAFREWRESCPKRLSGMFAFAIWDAIERRLFCARDRAGEKPFYYALAGGSFTFASEVKALLPWPGFRREVHLPALVDFLSFGFVPDPKTIWEGCRKLSPGHWMSVEAKAEGEPVVKPPVAYWDMEFEPDASVTDWGPQIRETLERAAKEMAYADVPVGTFLSGGVDSSSVTAALSKAGCSVKTFTVGFKEAEYDERRWAAEVSRLYSTAHTERLVVPEDVNPVLEKLLWHFDEPFNDYSYLPTFYVCREARNVITVALSGDGGDELFAGYSKYRRLALRQQVERFIPPSLARRLARGAVSVLPDGSALRSRIAPYAVDRSSLFVEMMTTGFSLDELRSSARGPLAQTLKDYSPADVVLPLLRKADPADVGWVNAMRYLDMKLTLAGDMLVKVDRASMAVSLEVRPVYLHREMMALGARIPPEALAAWNQSKKVLKAALRPWLPDSTLYRRKMGFALPLKNWMNGGLRQLFKPGEAEDPMDDLLDTRLLERSALARHSGGGEAVSRLHSLFFLRRWAGQWLSHDAGSGDGAVGAGAALAQTNEDYRGAL